MTPTRIFTATPRYIQGPGVLDRLPGIAAELGRRFLVVVDQALMDTVGSRIQASFRQASMDAAIVPFAGEATLAAAAGLVGRAGSPGPDLVIGVGGGRTLDVAKALARRLPAGFVSVPTVASTDAPASRGIVLYGDDHRPAANEQMVLNPLTVLVDTKVIAGAPIRYLRSGIGDAIAKKFEAEACARSGGRTKHGLPSSGIALAMGENCYRAIREHGARGLAAAGRGEPDGHMEALVEACLLTSALAFENGGLSIAHAVVRGLVAARGASAMLHGEQVAYGLLVQLALEGRPRAEILDMIVFYRTVGLPVSLADMGLPDACDAELDGIAELALGAPYIGHTRADVTRPAVVAAMRSLTDLAASAKR